MERRARKKEGDPHKLHAPCECWSTSKYANLHTAQIREYDSHMTQYLEELRILFPHVTLRPNHHAAQHIGDMMERFGPTHSHQAQFFERHIGFFHRINTNSRYSTMDGSILQGSVRYSNILAILRDDDQVRHAAYDIIEAMDSVEKEDLRGFRLAASLNIENSGIVVGMKQSHPVLLDGNVLDLLKSTEKNPHLLAEEVIYVPQISFRGVCYGIFDSKHYRDSSILFADSDPAVKYKMGVIQRIFRYAHNWYLLVDEHPYLDRADFSDPYKLYGTAAGFLCEAAAHVPCVIEASNILSHCVVTSIPEANCNHIMPVDRVSSHLIAWVDCIDADL